MPRSLSYLLILLLGILLGYAAHDRIRRELPGADELRTGVRAYGRTLVLFDPGGRVPARRIRLDSEIAACLAVDTDRGRLFVAGTRAFGTEVPGAVYAFHADGSPAWEDRVNPYDPALLRVPEGEDGPEPTLTPVNDVQTIEVRPFFGEDREFLAVWTRPRSFAVSRFLVLEPTTGEILFSFLNWGTPWKWAYGDWMGDGVPDLLVAAHNNGLAHRIAQDLHGTWAASYFRSAILLTPQRGAWTTGPGFARRDQVQGGFQWAVLHLPYTDGVETGGMNLMDVKFQEIGGRQRVFLDFPGDCIYMIDEDLSCESMKSTFWVENFGGREPPAPVLFTVDEEGTPSTRLLACGGDDPRATLAAFYRPHQIEILDRLLGIETWW